MTRIGGSTRVRTELEHAFEEGRGVTAKVKWLTRARDPNSDNTTHSEEGRSRWLHCTPLLGHTGKIGVWMVVLVDEETRPGDAQRRFRPAPPVAAKIRSQDADRAVFDDVVPSSPSKRTVDAGAGASPGGLRSHPVNGRESMNSLKEGHKRALAGLESKTSSFYGVVPSGKRWSKDSAPVSPVSAVSRPQSEISFALR